MMIDEEPINM